MIFSCGMVWLGTEMVLARMTAWKFKSNKREQGINTLYEALTGPARNQKGFLGSITLLSQDDEGTVTTMSIWETEEARANSEVFLKKAFETLQESLTDPPEMKKFRVYSAELKVGLQQ
jgi:heme-degrading monooxygenase HmoA